MLMAVLEGRAPNRRTLRPIEVAASHLAAAAADVICFFSGESSMRPRDSFGKTDCRSFLSFHDFANFFDSFILPKSCSFLSVMIGGRRALTT